VPFAIAESPAAWVESGRCARKHA